ncbi:MAG: hypothetical protein FGM15_07760 [Chthoniobacterales bacterium]|nr:hypothetical protein [Chthoniobacterales bacterium]
MLAVITTGPASVPIDEVRRITNFASGEIGAILAATLAQHGFETLLFRGRGATHTEVPAGALLHQFTANRDLAQQLATLSETRGNDVRCVFHAAALSDYEIAGVHGPGGTLDGARKIPGSLARIQIVLEPAAKILPQLRGWFPHAWIVGWKYELEGTREDAIDAARMQISGGSADATVLNGTAYGPGFGFLAEKRAPLHFDRKRELADFLAARAAHSAGGSQ